MPLRCTGLFEQGAFFLPFFLKTFQSKSQNSIDSDSL